MLEIVFSLLIGMVLLILVYLSHVRRALKIIDDNLRIVDDSKESLLFFKPVVRRLKDVVLEQKEKQERESVKNLEGIRKIIETMVLLEDYLGIEYVEEESKSVPARYVKKKKDK